jgi:hypothetical protein
MGHVPVIERHARPPAWALFASAPALQPAHVSLCLREAAR